MYRHLLSTFILSVLLLAVSSAAALSITCNQPELIISQSNLSAANEQISVTIPAATLGNSGVCRSVTIRNVDTSNIVFSVHRRNNVTDIKLLVVNVVFTGLSPTQHSCINVVASGGGSSIPTIDNITVSNSSCVTQQFLRLSSAFEFSNELTMDNNSHSNNNPFDSSSSPVLVYAESDLLLALNAALALSGNRINSGAGASLVMVMGKLYRGENSTITVSASTVRVTTPEFLRVFNLRGSEEFGCASGNPLLSPESSTIHIVGNSFTVVMTDPTQASGQVSRYAPITIDRYCGTGARLRVASNVFHSNVVIGAFFLRGSALPRLDITSNSVVITGPAGGAIFYPRFFIIKPRSEIDAEALRVPSPVVNFVGNSLRVTGTYPSDPLDPVTGDPVEQVERERIYFLDFWAAKMPNGAEDVVLRDATIVVSDNRVYVEPKRGMAVAVVSLFANVNASTLVLQNNVLTAANMRDAWVESVDLSLHVLVTNRTIAPRSMWIRYNGVEVVDAVPTALASLIGCYLGVARLQLHDAPLLMPGVPVPSGNEGDQRRFAVVFDGNWIEQRTRISIGKADAAVFINLLTITAARDTFPTVVFSLYVANNLLEWTAGLLAMESQRESMMQLVPVSPQIMFRIFYMDPAQPMRRGGFDPRSSSSPAPTFTALSGLVVERNVVNVASVRTVGSVVTQLVFVDGWMRLFGGGASSSFVIRNNVFSSSAESTASFFSTLEAMLLGAVSIEGGTFDFVIERQTVNATAPAVERDVPVGVTGTAVVLSGNKMTATLTGSDLFPAFSFFFVKSFARGLGGGIQLDSNTVDVSITAHSLCFFSLVSISSCTAESVPLVSLRNSRTSVSVTNRNVVTHQVLSYFEMMSPDFGHKSRVVAAVVLPKKSADDPALLADEEKLDLLRLRVVLRNESFSVAVDSRVATDKKAQDDLSLLRSALVSTRSGIGEIVFRGVDISDVRFTTELRGRLKLLQAALDISLVGFVSLKGGGGAGSEGGGGALLSILRLVLTATMSDRSVVGDTTRFNSSVIALGGGTTVEAAASSGGGSGSPPLLFFVQDVTVLPYDNINEYALRRRLLSFGVVSTCVSALPETECRGKKVELSGSCVFDRISIGGGARAEFQALEHLQRWQADEKLYDQAPRRYFLDAASASLGSTSTTALSTVFGGGASFTVTNVFGALQFAAAVSPGTYAALSFPSVAGSTWDVPCKVNGFAPRAMLRALLDRSLNSTVCRCAAPWCTATNPPTVSRTAEATESVQPNCAALGLKVVPGAAAASSGSSPHRRRYAYELGMSRPTDLYVSLANVSLARFVSVLGGGASGGVAFPPVSAASVNNISSVNTSSGIKSIGGGLQLSGLVQILPSYADDPNYGSLRARIVSAEVLGGFVVRLSFVVRTGGSGNGRPSSLRPVSVGVRFSNYSFTCDSGADTPWITMEGRVLFEQSSGFGGFAVSTTASVLSVFSLAVGRSPLAPIMSQRSAFLRRHLSCSVDSTSPPSFFESPLGLVVGEGSYAVPRGTVVGNCLLYVLGFALSLVPMVYFNWRHRVRMLAVQRYSHSVSQGEEDAAARSGCLAFCSWFLSRLVHRGPFTFCAVRAQRFGGFPSNLWLFILVPTLQGSIAAGFTLIMQSAQFLDTLVGFIIVFPVCGSLFCFVLYCIFPVRNGFDKRVLPRLTLHKERHQFEKGVLYFSDGKQWFLRQMYYLFVPIIVWRSLLPPSKKEKRKEKLRRELLKRQQRLMRQQSGELSSSSSSSSDGSSSSSESDPDNSNSDDDEESSVKKLPPKINGQRRATYFLVERLGSVFDVCRDDWYLFNFIVCDALPSAVFGFMGATASSSSAYWCNSLRIVACAFVATLFVLALRRPLTIAAENLYLVLSSACLLLMCCFIIAAITGTSSADKYIAGAHQVASVLDVLNIVKFLMDLARVFFFPSFVFGRCHRWYQKRQQDQLQRRRRAGLFVAGNHIEHDEDDDDLLQMAATAAGNNNSSQRKKKRKKNDGTVVAGGGGGGGVGGESSLRMPERRRTLEEIRSAAAARDHQDNFRWWTVADEDKAQARIKEIERKRTHVAKQQQQQQQSSSPEPSAAVDGEAEEDEEEFNLEEDDDDAESQAETTVTTTSSKRVRFDLPAGLRPQDEPRKKPKRIKQQQQEEEDDDDPALRELKQTLVQHSVSPDIVRHVVANKKAVAQEDDDAARSSVIGSIYNRKSSPSASSSSSSPHSSSSGKLSADEYYTWLNAVKHLQPVRAPKAAAGDASHRQQQQQEQQYDDDDDNDHDYETVSHSPSKRSRISAAAPPSTVFSAGGSSSVASYQRRGTWLGDHEDRFQRPQMAAVSAAPEWMKRPQQQQQNQQRESSERSDAPASSSPPPHRHHYSPPHHHDGNNDDDHHMDDRRSFPSSRVSSAVAPHLASAATSSRSSVAPYSPSVSSASSSSPPRRRGVPESERFGML